MGVCQRDGGEIYGMTRKDPRKVVGAPDTVDVSSPRAAGFSDSSGLGYYLVFLMSDSLLPCLYDVSGPMVAERRPVGPPQGRNNKPSTYVE